VIRKDSGSALWRQQRQGLQGPKEFTFLWEGRDKGGKVIRGELRSVSESAVNATLRRQGIKVQKVKKQSSAAAARSPTRTSRCSRASWPP
jgi:type II secretory pathway component PulF